MAEKKWTVLRVGRVERHDGPTGEACVFIPDWHMENHEDSEAPAFRLEGTPRLESGGGRSDFGQFSTPPPTLMTGGTSVIMSDEPGSAQRVWDTTTIGGWHLAELEVMAAEDPA